MSAPALKLYVKLWCPWCIKAMRMLDERHIPYQTLDVLASRATYDEMIALSGQSLTPTLEYEGEILADFGPPELEKFLAAHPAIA